jgi:hypothetical protein
MNENYAGSAESAVKLIADIIKKHGSRVSGSKGNSDACSDLETLSGKYCTSARRESFGIHPDSLFATGRIFTVTYLTGLLKNTQ